MNRGSRVASLSATPPPGSRSPANQKLTGTARRISVGIENPETEAGDDGEHKEEAHRHA